MFGVLNSYVFDVVTVSITGQQACITTVPGYVSYYTYFVNPVFTFGLPLIVISTFTILTSVNINHLDGRRKQIV